MQEQAANHLRTACTVLAPYDSNHYVVLKKGYGEPQRGLAFDAAVCHTKKR